MARLISHVGLWPNADVDCHLSVRPLSDVKRSWRRHTSRQSNSGPVRAGPEPPMPSLRGQTWRNCGAAKIATADCRI